MESKDGGSGIGVISGVGAGEAVAGAVTVVGSATSAVLFETGTVPVPQPKSAAGSMTTAKNALKYLILLFDNTFFMDQFI